MLLKAPAKINLTLKVLSKRADGYHEISSIMQGIHLFDEVDITVREGGMCIRVSSDMPCLPEGPKNLAYRAAELAAGEWGSGESDITVNIKKNIPVAAGLGGGSADAAAVLLGLAKEYNVTSLEKIAALGARLGADVPFCVYTCAAANPEQGYKGASAALAEGIGDIITPLTDAAPGVPQVKTAHIVLVKPPIEISSAGVYALFDEYENRMDRASEGASSGNDLEAPCAESYPVVAETLELLTLICAEEAHSGFVKTRLPLHGAVVQLSGSGPAVFAYIEEGPEETDIIAENIYDRAVREFPGMFVCLTRTL